MRVIGILLIALAIFTVLTMLFGMIKRLQSKQDPGPKQFEPDLEVLQKPNQIARIPENEEEIPDSTAGSSKKRSA